LESGSEDPILDLCGGYGVLASSDGPHSCFSGAGSDRRLLGERDLVRCIRLIGGRDRQRRQIKLSSSSIPQLGRCQFLWLRPEIWSGCGGGRLDECLGGDAWTGVREEPAGQG
jgi:hypothetical protein